MASISQISHPAVYSLSEDPAAMKYLASQLAVYHQSLSLQTTQRLYHSEDYTDGTPCAVNGKKRRLRLFYFCDEYAAYQGMEAERVDELNGLTGWEEEAMVRQFDKIYNQEFIDYLKQQKEERKKRTHDAQPLGWRVHDEPDEFVRDFKLLEFSEPDWCVYHAKIATRYMCGAASYQQLQKARNGERKKMNKKAMETMSKFEKHSEGSQSATSQTSSKADSNQESSHEIICNLVQDESVSSTSSQYENKMHDEWFEKEL